MGEFIPYTPQKVDPALIDATPGSDNAGSHAKASHRIVDRTSSVPVPQDRITKLGCAPLAEAGGVCAC